MSYLIWNCFVLPEESSQDGNMRVVCRICKSSLSCSRKSASNLHKHMRARHPVEYKPINDVRPKRNMKNDKREYFDIESFAADIKPNLEELILDMNDANEAASLTAGDAGPVATLDTSIDIQQCSGKRSMNDAIFPGQLTDDDSDDDLDDPAPLRAPPPPPPPHRDGDDDSSDDRFGVEMLIAAAHLDPNDHDITSPPLAPSLSGDYRLNDSGGGGGDQSVIGAMSNGSALALQKYENCEHLNNSLNTSKNLCIQSSIWTHFNLPDDTSGNFRCICRYCNVTISCCKRSSSNLHKHLKRKHSNAYNVPLPGQQPMSAGTLVDYDQIDKELIVYNSYKNSDFKGNFQLYGGVATEAYPEEGCVTSPSETFDDPADKTTTTPTLTLMSGDPVQPTIRSIVANVNDSVAGVNEMVKNVDKNDLLSTSAAGAGGGGGDHLFTSLYQNSTPTSRRLNSNRNMKRTSFSFIQEPLLKKQLNHHNHSQSLLPPPVNKALTPGDLSSSVRDPGIVALDATTGEDATTSSVASYREYQRGHKRGATTSTAIFNGFDHSPRRRHPLPSFGTTPVAGVVAGGRAPYNNKRRSTVASLFDYAALQSKRLRTEASVVHRRPSDDEQEEEEAERDDNVEMKDTSKMATLDYDSWHVDRLIKYKNEIEKINKDKSVFNYWLEQNCSEWCNSFKDMMDVMQPGYALPTQAQLTDVYLPSNYDQLKDKLMKSLADVKSLTVCVDHWSTNRYEYVTIIGVYTSLEWGREVVLLDLSRYEIKLGENVNIKKLVMDTLKDFEIADKVNAIIKGSVNNIHVKQLYGDDTVAMATETSIRDGEGVHLKLQGISEFECFEATIKEVVRQSVFTYLESCDADTHLKVVTSLKSLDIAKNESWFTRLNALYLQVTDTVAKQKSQKEENTSIDSEDTTSLTNDTEDKSNLSIDTNEDIDCIVKQFISDVKPFLEALKMITKCRTCGIVIPTIRVLKHLNSSSTLAAILERNVAVKCEQFETSEFYQISAILDPRFKIDWAENETETSKLKQLLVTTVQNNANQCNDKTSFFFNLFSNETHVDLNEINMYLNEPRSAETEDVSLFWKKSQFQFPKLCSIITRYLHCPVECDAINDYIRIKDGCYENECRVLSCDQFKMAAFIKKSNH